MLSRVDLMMGWFENWAVLRTKRASRELSPDVWLDEYRKTGTELHVDLP